MKRNVLLKDDMRIGATSDPPFSAGPGEFSFDFPDGFDFERQSDWKIIDGALVYDPVPEPEPIPDPGIRIAALEEELLMSYLAQAELYERTLAQEQETLATMLAVAEIYEMMIGGN